MCRTFLPPSTPVDYQCSISLLILFVFLFMHPHFLGPSVVRRRISGLVFSELVSSRKEVCAKCCRVVFRRAVSLFYEYLNVKMSTAFACTSDEHGCMVSISPLRVRAFASLFKAPATSYSCLSMLCLLVLSSSLPLWHCSDRTPDAPQLLKVSRTVEQTGMNACHFTGSNNKVRSSHGGRLVHCRETFPPEVRADGRCFLKSILP